MPLVELENAINSLDCCFYNILACAYSGAKATFL